MNENVQKKILGIYEAKQLYGYTIKMNKIEYEKINISKEKV